MTVGDMEYINYQALWLQLKKLFWKLRVHTFSVPPSTALSARLRGNHLGNCKNPTQIPPSPTSDKSYLNCSHFSRAQQTTVNDVFKKNETGEKQYVLFLGLPFCYNLQIITSLLFVIYSSYCCIHSKSNKVCGFCFSVSTNVRKKCANRDNNISRQKWVKQSKV